MQRFFLPPHAFQGNRVVFTPDQSHQIYRVLRLKPGQSVIVLDGSGMEYVVELKQVGATAVQGDILSSVKRADQDEMVIRLYVSLTQREKFEWILQKCTEIGVSGIIPVIFARSLVAKTDDPGKKRLRWEKIVQEAAEQSKRSSVPEVHSPVQYKDALVSPLKNTLRLLAWEDEQHQTLRQAVREAYGSAGSLSASEISILVGPEGGFTEEEVHTAIQVGWQPVTLGRNTLRMETAAVVAVTLALHSLIE